MRKQLLDWETDYEALKQKICRPTGFINLDCDDLEILRSGETAYIWKSPLAGSVEETVELARQAAREMAPEPGRVILAAVLSISAYMEVNLETIEKITGVIQERFGEDADYILDMEPCEEGTRFILVTAEGRADGEKESL